MRRGCSGGADVHGGNDEAAPSLLATRRLEEGRGAGFPRVGNLGQRGGAQEVHGDVEEVGEDGQAGEAREEGEEREEEGRLVVDAAVVRRDIVVVEKEAFLYCAGRDRLAQPPHTTEAPEKRRHIQRLKLVTGVEISTRPVRSSGSPGKSVNSASRRMAAPAYSPAVLPKVTLPPSISQVSIASAWRGGRSLEVRVGGQVTSGLESILPANQFGSCRLGPARPTADSLISPYR